MIVKKILMTGLLILAFFSSLAMGESLVPEIPLKGKYTQDYQTAYLALLCADNVIKNGDIFLNITRIRAVCDGINTPTTETITLNQADNTIQLGAGYCFDDIAKVTFLSAKIAPEKLIQQDVLNKHRYVPSDQYYHLLIGSRTYSFTKEDIISLFSGVETAICHFSIISPYSKELPDIEIELFDNSKNDVFSEEELLKPTKEWEKEYGDYRLWDYQINALYANKYKTMPGPEYNPVIPGIPDTEEQILDLEDVKAMALALLPDNTNSKGFPDKKSLICVVHAFWPINNAWDLQFWTPRRTDIRLYCEVLVDARDGGILNCIYSLDWMLDDY